jgi:hypothetical protein
MRQGTRLGIALISIAGMLSTAAGARAQFAETVHLYHSLWELRDADLEVRESKWSFGLQKEKTLFAMREAKTKIELLLNHRDINDRGTPVRGDLREVYRKYTHHPHMQNALFELRESYRELRASRHLYGGHRDAALRDINYAIDQMDVLLREARRP